MGDLTPPRTIRRSMAQRLQRRSTARGEIVVPAVPHMLDEYVVMCEEAFAATGCTFTDEQRAHLSDTLLGQLQLAFDASPRSSIVISYESPVGSAVTYWIKSQWLSLEQAYDDWVSTREPPLFGTHPDARVWALAVAAGDPREVPVLDVGAGTGRNSLALARRGHPVDAVELSPAFAEVMRTEARRELLKLRVIEGDVFAADTKVLDDYGLILLSEVVSDFRSAAQLRAIFDLAANRLAPGGHLVFNAFLAVDGFVPDAAVRELGQQMYTSVFTRAELAAASADLPLVEVADDSVHDYEQAHLPEGAWPQTSWYVDWVTGRDVFDLPREKCPIDMRWLVYRRT